MKSGSILLIMIFSIAVLFQPEAFTAQKTVKLVKPDVKGGAPLMRAISNRHSSRSFSDRTLPEQTLSSLLWAANGVNRADSGKRTAPSAMNKQEIDIYVAMKEGLYIYDAKNHELVLIADKDVRALTGQQPYVKDAPLNLVYVADMSKAAGGDGEEKIMYAAADAGFVGENVYLYCASEGLNTVIRAYIDKEALAKSMNLRKEQKIILSQTVGYPGK